MPDRMPPTMMSGASKPDHAERTACHKGAQIEASGDRPQLRIIRMVGVELHRDHQRESDQDSRDDSAEEQAADRNLRDRSIDDHDHAGRDDRPDCARSRDQRCRKSGLVAGLLHRRDGDRGDGRRVGRGRAGDAGDRHARHDGGMREAGAEMANQRARKVNELPADSTGRHDRSGQNEIGHCQQREGIELREHLLCEERHHDFG